MTFCTFIIFVAISSDSQSAELVLNNVAEKACLSPNGGCTEAIINEINNAKSEILVQAYSFTSSRKANSLLDAHKRGVKVEAILNLSQRTQNYSSVTFPANARTPIYIEENNAIAHNKVMIIDGLTVVTGSFNFTKAAEVRNTDNLMMIKS